MCGIAGFAANPNETGFDARRIANTLLVGIQNRGTDATGSAWWHNQHIWIQKDAVPAHRFIRGHELPATASTVILHTRAATVGTPNNPDNNHPIQVGPVVGVHNGRVENHDHLLELTGSHHTRQAEVDSEAIFAVVAYGTLTNHDRPLIDTTIERSLSHVDGSGACAWLDQDEGPRSVHIARSSGRRLWVAITQIGSIIWASNPAALIAATRDISRVVDLWELPRFTHLWVDNSRVVEVASIPRRSPAVPVAA